MSAFALLPASAIPAFAVSPTAVCPAPEKLNASQRTLTSNFAATGQIDSKQWSKASGNPFGNSAVEAQVYDPGQVSVIATAGLSLSTLPAEAGAPKPYKSGAIHTLGKFSQLYGHFEAMIQFPETNGIWPAFWLLPANGTWPPEIDIVEFIAFPNGVAPAARPGVAPWFGMDPATTMHWTGSNSQHQQLAPMVGNSIDTTNVYPGFNDKVHKYALDWRPGSLNFVLDDVPVFCVTGAAVPATPMYMIINQAVSNGTASKPGWAGYVAVGTSWPQTTRVTFIAVAK